MQNSKYDSFNMTCYLWKKTRPRRKMGYFMACLILLTHNETEINLVYFCCLRKFLTCDMGHIIWLMVVWAIIWWKVTFIHIIASFLHSTFTVKGVDSSKIDSSSVALNRITTLKKHQLLSRNDRFLLMSAWYKERRQKIIGTIAK